MRNIVIAFILFGCSQSLSAQLREVPNSKVLSQKAIMEGAQSILDDYIRAVEMAADCKNGAVHLASFLQLFTSDALIEVSSRNRASIPPRTPSAYINGLRRLCIAGIYDEIHFDFSEEMLQRDNLIYQFGGACEIDRRIQQTFKGYKNKDLTYCDVTIRRISIIFYRLKDGSYQPFIKHIAIEETNPCLPNI